MDKYNDFIKELKERNFGIENKNSQVEKLMDEIEMEPRNEIRPNLAMKIVKTSMRVAASVLLVFFIYQQYETINYQSVIEQQIAAQPKESFDGQNKYYENNSKLIRNLEQILASNPSFNTLTIDDKYNKNYGDSNSQESIRN